MVGWTRAEEEGGLPALAGVAPRRARVVRVCAPGSAHLLRPPANVTGCGFPFPGVSRHALTLWGHLWGGSASIHLLHPQEEGDKPTLGVGAKGNPQFPSIRRNKVKLGREYGDGTPSRVTCLIATNKIHGSRCKRLFSFWGKWRVSHETVARGPCKWHQK